LQKNVADWESKFNAEKQNDLKRLELQHQEQMERLAQA
jgi:hypothetical protein